MINIFPATIRNSDPFYTGPGRLSFYQHWFQWKKGNLPYGMSLYAFLLSVTQEIWVPTNFTHVSKSWQLCLHPFPLQWVVVNIAPARSWRGDSGGKKKQTQKQNQNQTRHIVKIGWPDVASAQVISMVRVGWREWSRNWGSEPGGEDKRDINK